MANTTIPEHEFAEIVRILLIPQVIRRVIAFRRLSKWVSSPKAS